MRWNAQQKIISYYYFKLKIHKPAMTDDSKKKKKILSLRKCMYIYKCTRALTLYTVDGFVDLLLMADLKFNPKKETPEFHR